nr:MAG TPA: hypothetical protein [Caudoviricetes sp.]
MADEKADEGVKQVPVERSVVLHIKNPFKKEPDFSGYSDPYGFAPLPPGLEATLAKMVDDGGFDSEDDAAELERLGYVSDLTFYFRQYARWEITPKGKSYASDKAEYLKRREAWVRQQRQHERGQFAREILIAVISATIGSIVTQLIAGR